MKEPAFAAAVSQRRVERVSEVTGSLVAMAPRALRALSECLDAERPADRIRAAMVILSAVHRYRDLAEFEDRLAGLERSRAGISSDTGDQS